MCFDVIVIFAFSACEYWNSTFTKTLFHGGAFLFKCPKPGRLGNGTIASPQGDKHPRYYYSWTDSNMVQTAINQTGQHEACGLALRSLCTTTTVKDRLGISIESDKMDQIPCILHTEA